MKKSVVIGVFFSIVITLLIITVRFNTDYHRRNVFVDNDSIKYIAKVNNQYFYLYQDDKWNKTFIKGVNIGATKPGYFPGEHGIAKKDYLRWFHYISNMGANTIRVYTMLKPEFYEALYEYNKNRKDPLYLMQGVWINEEDIQKQKNAYNPVIMDRFKQDIAAIIDVIHGNKKVSKESGLAYGLYNKDISNYVIGYILGIEWDPEFVVSTNKINKSNVSYDGIYLNTQHATPFETFLCEVGDYAIGYEMDKYSMQNPISFTNWVTTDMLIHPNEPLVNEDMVSVNMEHIKKKDNYKTGLFASYHIYPYYPDSMSYQEDYINFYDENNKINPYRAYLKDLKKEHTMPIIVAEFGVPSSRGIAHENKVTGFNQGNLTEEEQGEMDASMIRDIFLEDFAGGIVFAFQDEWFKTTWNTMDFDIPDRRAYWNNSQTNEQHFGLMAFDSGKTESTCYVDGDSKDWSKEKPLIKDMDKELYVKSDETYLYIMYKDLNYDFLKDTLIIPINTIENQGNIKYKTISFSQNVDFIIEINGKDNSSVKVDAYYDSFTYLYNDEHGIIYKNSIYEQKNSGSFVPIYLCLNKELYIKNSNMEIPFSMFETGKLKFGNGNPNSKNYNSLSDFYVKGNILEIRLPWQILNVMDPSKKMIMDDFHTNGIKPKLVEGFHFGCCILEKDKQTVNMNLYSWRSWDMPIYHERLKQSYFILKEAFKKYNYD
ncbi:MAG: hypothetical protein K0S41_1623 [Anaerocolumna sp.]|jgi:hypothetical protein|nr:hypothetical protein [Anaerocolumna sp.]